MTVERDGFAATYYQAGNSERGCGVIVLGGSEGGVPERYAKAVADEGYAVLALAYFKSPGTPSHLDEIPLEYFDKAVSWFVNTAPMKGKKTVLLGASKGAELALLLASRKREIEGVVAISPSSVVFQGIPEVFWPPRSSWITSQTPVPFVPYDISGGIDPNNLRKLYERSLSNREKASQAAIPVERINGPILLLSGEEDSMWPASTMADAVTKRLQQKSFKHHFRHVKYDDAGHTLSEYYMLGGTAEGNKTARIDSWRRVFAFVSVLSEGK
ncbi:MAG: acyl-CoA thioester hydrolase/BAAT C-terminal domain-containing protein [Planctomycetota bacterium]